MKLVYGISEFSPAGSSQQLQGNPGYHLVTGLWSVGEWPLSSGTWSLQPGICAQLSSGKSPCASACLELHKYSKPEITLTEKWLLMGLFTEKSYQFLSTFFNIRSAIQGCHKELPASLLPRTVVLNLKGEGQTQNKDLRLCPSGENELLQLTSIYK